jgi:hypothetical protein
MSMDEDLARIRAMIAELKARAPEASRAALAELVPKVQQGVKVQATLDMDRPVPFTLGAIMYNVDDRGFGGGRVFVADRFRSGGADESHYLGVQTLGGTRTRKKASEISFQRMGIMPVGTVWVPDGSVRLDNNGNVPARAIRAAIDEFAQYGRRQAPGRNFYVRGGVNYPTFGIFTRVGDEFYPWLWFVSPRRYAELFDFYGRAMSEAKYHFDEIYSKQMRKLLEQAGSA